MKRDKGIIRSTKDIRKTRGSAKPEVLMPVPASLLEMPTGYAAFFAGLKERIARGRIRAVLSANSAMVLMYWDIGQAILERQKQEGWGAKVIDRLSYDLKKAFPEMTGFSPRNLKYLRTFANAWPDLPIVQEVLAQITWYHNLALLEKTDDPKIRLWYANKTLEYGWSRNILAIQIETRLHERQGKAISNFPKGFCRRWAYALMVAVNLTIRQRVNIRFQLQRSWTRPSCWRILDGVQCFCDQLIFSGYLFSPVRH